jgi:hypothetical protein
MINLIPEIVRTQIVKEYWVRTSSVFLLLTSVASVMVVVFALPVYVLISYQVDVYTDSATVAAARVAEYDTSTSALIEANKMAQQVTDLRSVQNFSSLIELVEAERKDGVVISGFSFNRDGVKVTPFQVNGRAATRQDLADFRAALLRQEIVEEAILPISNLAKDKDIEFSLSVKLKTVKP